MSKHVAISPEEAADRLTIRELIEAYAHCADRRDAKGQMALFTADTHFVVYMNAKDPKPSQELHSREATIFTLKVDRALFGCRRNYPLMHLGSAGLIWAIDGGKIIELHREWAVIDRPVNRSQRVFYRRDVDAAEITLPWISRAGE
jgi:hypothetical protein